MRHIYARAVYIAKGEIFYGAGGGGGGKISVPPRRAEMDFPS